MNNTTRKIEVSGAHALSQAILDQGIDTVFGIIGHGNLALIDSFLDFPELKFISTYHEQVAIHAADAFYRVSGNLSIVTSTVGPGATNLITGLADALLDCSAVVVLTSGVPSQYTNVDALQSLSYNYNDSQSEIFRPVSKRVYEVRFVEELVSIFIDAVNCAINGTPGPVVVHVPLDLYSKKFTPKHGSSKKSIKILSAPIQGEIDRVISVIETAKKPVIYCGGGAQSLEFSKILLGFLNRFPIPVATSMSGQGVLPDSHACHTGTTGVVGTEPGNYAVRNADVVIVFGSQFPEMDASSWREGFFPSFPPCQLIRIDINSDKLITGIQADIAIQADSGVALEMLLASLTDKAKLHWSEWIEEIQTIKADWANVLMDVRTNPVLPFEPAFLLTKLRELLAPESIIVSGVGVRHSLAQHFPILEPRSLVVASGFGTMGQEVGAAIGAKLAKPDRPVVAIVGDGALMACIAALPTAASLQLPLIWIVLDNGGYASIAVYQAKHFGRHTSTFFESGSGNSYSPDYLKLGESFGVRSFQVKSVDDLKEHIQIASTIKGPSMIVVPVSQKPRNFGSGHWDVNDILANVGE